MKKIILASRSHRRRSLMPFVTNDFSVKYSDIEEILLEEGNPVEQATKIAKEKAYDVFEKNPNAIVIGAYTVAYVNGHVLGKPLDDEDSTRMLYLLNGKTHQVITVCYIKSKEKESNFSCTTAVTFTKMSNEEIEYYINTGEGMEKSGAYAIQGLGSRYITNIAGDFYNVLGLPVYQLYNELKKY